MAAILLQAFLVSCTQVEFSGMVESFDGMESFARTNMSKVAFNVTLPENLVDGNQPQYMTVLLNRTRAEMCRYVYNLDADGVAIPEESDTLVINDGFYLVSSIAAGSPEDFKISELDSFKTDDALLISDMYVYPGGEPALRRQRAGQDQPAGGYLYLRAGQELSLGL